MAGSESHERRTSDEDVTSYDEDVTSYAVGKRASVDDPLTAHDVAERLNRAALRTLRILTDARDLGIAREVSVSRYLASGLLQSLADEIEAWRTDAKQ